MFTPSPLYIYVEDWTPFVSQLDKKGLPHEGVLYKAYCSEKDPRIELKRSDIFVYPTEGKPFSATDVFRYEERGAYTGLDFEQLFERRGIKEEDRVYARGLFRFVSDPDIGFDAVSMQIQREHGWLRQHPFEMIDGLPKEEEDLREPGWRMHIDLYWPFQLAKLRELMGAGMEGRLGIYEGARFKRTMRDPEWSKWAMKERG